MDIQIKIENNDNHNMIWKKDSKRKISVMILIKSRIKVINVEYGKGKAESACAQFVTKYGETKK